MRGAREAMKRIIALFVLAVFAAQVSMAAQAEGMKKINDLTRELRAAKDLNEKVKFRDENFEERTVMAENIEAIVFQHEIDHLNGVLYKDRVQKPYRAEPVQGRNEPCACNSGKKFKKCCGGNL